MYCFLLKKFFYFLLFVVVVQLPSCVWLFATPRTAACQASPSLGFSRQEYWSGFPFPSPGDLPDPGIKPRSPTLQADALTYAAAAKSLQSCPILWDPIDGSPPGSPLPGILQSRTLEWVAISFSSAWKWKVKVKSLSHVRLFMTPWTAAYQAPPSMGFSRQEYWSGVPLSEIADTFIFILDVLSYLKIPCTDCSYSSHPYFVPFHSQITSSLKEMLLFSH